MDRSVQVEHYFQDSINLTQAGPHPTMGKNS